jgi:3-hydroxyacyl-[acyl-carrier-protein] dehydratase
LESAEVVERLAPICGRDVILDRVTVAPDGTVTGYKYVSAAEACFQGHFPGHPILPGVIQIEAMAQLVQLAAIELSGRQLSLIEVNRGKFRKPVHPGDLLVIEADIAEDGLSATCTTKVDGAVTCQARLVLKEETLAPISGPTTPFSPDFDSETLTVEDVMSIIPHRYPFLLIDRMYREKDTDETGQLVGIKNVTTIEGVFRAGRPWVAPTMLMEMCAQSGCVAALDLPENAGKIGYFMAIDNAEFHRSVQAGTQLVIVMKNLSLRGRIGQGRAEIYVGDEFVAACELKFALVQPEG